MVVFAGFGCGSYACTTLRFGDGGGGRLGAIGGRTARFDGDDARLDDVVEGVELGGEAAGLGRFGGLEFTGATDDVADVVTKTLDDGFEAVDDGLQVGVRGSSDAETGLLRLSCGEGDKRETKAFAEHLEGGLGDEAGCRADADVAFGGEEGLGGADGGAAGDLAAEGDEVDVRVLGDDLEEGLGHVAESAESGDAEGDESGAGLAADVAVSSGLLLSGGSEDGFDGLATVLVA